MSEQNQYTEDNIRSLDWKEHIRMRPGMYIGKLGDGFFTRRWYLYPIERSFGQLYR
jgi:DNA gyrase/topoisomerase IV subunit B